MTRGESARISIASAILATWVWIVARSCREVAVVGTEVLEAVKGRGEPVILCLWHNRMFYMLDFLARHFVRRGVVVHPLISRSKDGEIFARMATRFGFRVVRGSTSRGAAAGLRRLTQLIRRGGTVATVGDGPRGPRYVCKAGPVSLAKLTGSPIVPLAYAVDRAWTVDSWDRLILPRPFARVAVAVGEPIRVPSDATGVGLAERLEMLQRRLEETVEQATAALDGARTAPG